MTAIVFPGQGSQYVNMSMDFNENFDVARKVFQEIEDITQINIRKIITENPLDNLNQTKLHSDINFLCIYGHLQITFK